MTPEPSWDNAFFAQCLIFFFHLQSFLCYLKFSPSHMPILIDSFPKTSDRSDQIINLFYSANFPARPLCPPILLKSLGVLCSWHPEIFLYHHSNFPFWILMPLLSQLTTSYCRIMNSSGFLRKSTRMQSFFRLSNEYIFILLLTIVYNLPIFGFLVKTHSLHSFLAYVALTSPV